MTNLDDSFFKNGRLNELLVFLRDVLLFFLLLVFVEAHDTCLVDLIRRSDKWVLRDELNLLNHSFQWVKHQLLCIFSEEKRTYTQN